MGLPLRRCSLWPGTMSTSQIVAAIRRCSSFLLLPFVIYLIMVGVASTERRSILAQSRRASWSWIHTEYSSLKARDVHARRVRQYDYGFGTGRDPILRWLACSLAAERRGRAPTPDRPRSIHRQSVGLSVHLFLAAGLRRRGCATTSSWRWGWLLIPVSLVGDGRRDHPSWRNQGYSVLDRLWCLAALFVAAAMVLLLRKPLSAPGARASGTATRGRRHQPISDTTAASRCKLRRMVLTLIVRLSPTSGAYPIWADSGPRRRTKLLDAVAGFGVTLGLMFKKIVTGRSTRKAGPKARYHGRQLNRYPDGLEKCIGCELCA